MSRPNPRRTPAAEATKPIHTSSRPAALQEDDDFPLELWGERLRRFCLGSLAALVACRPFWPGEDASSGTGLLWVFLVLILAGLSVGALVLGGSFRPRWSITDVAVLLTMIAVGMSSRTADDRRAAIIMAWEWGGLAIAYLLARQLPRNKSESQALLGVLAASAVAVAVYGIYQIQVELEEVRRIFRMNPEATLARIGISSDSGSRAAFENRLLNSNEPWSTFALTNSLAGFIVGPFVLGIAIAFERLRKKEPIANKIQAFVLAAFPGLILAICLMATKSRSAWVGAAAAIAFVAVQAWGKISTKVFAGLFFGAILVVGGLVAAGFATGQLDIQVLTESSKSLKYRGEYWQATWNMINHKEGVFWQGLGPANFGTPYLEYKLPQSSEEILDPHNFLLEVWSTAGLTALLFLLAALASAFWNFLMPGDREPIVYAPADPDAMPPQTATWLFAFGSLGWILVTFIGGLNPFAGDLIARWVILGLAWVGAVLLAAPLWSGTTWPKGAVGALIMALLIDLLAAGGIGIPPVAMVLWLGIALGLNLRDDRGCGSLRQPISRWWLTIPAFVWAAVMGTFAGAIGPHWKSQGFIAQAEALMSKKPQPDFDKAMDSYLEAAKADPYSAAPWLGLANLEYSYYRSPDAQGIKNIWSRILLTYDKAVEKPRPNTVSVQRLRASVAKDIFSRLGEDAVILDDIRLLGYINRANRIAAQLYPTSAILRAELAISSAKIGFYPDAVKEAREAIRLSEFTPHIDKKLPEKLRAELEAKLPEWEQMKPPEIIKDSK